MSAFDLDKKVNAKLNYSILSDTETIRRTFVMNSESGVVKLARDLQPNGVYCSTNKTILSLDYYSLLVIFQKKLIKPCVERGFLKKPLGKLPGVV